MERTQIDISRRDVLKKGAVATGALVLGGTTASGTAAAGIGDGRVLDYHLNNVNYDKERGETVAGHVHDTSTYGNDGVWVNETNDPVVSGPVGNAYDFDEGEGDYIAITGPSGLEVEEVTIAAWVNPNKSTDGHNYIFDGPGHNYYLKQYVETKQPEFGFFNENGFNQLVAETALSTDTWTHVTATYDQDTMRLYLDGSEVTSTPASKPIQRYSDGAYKVDSGEARVGRYLSSNQYGAYYFDGGLDEVRVYGRALTEPEITDLATMDEE